MQLSHKIWTWLFCAVLYFGYVTHLHILTIYLLHSSAFTGSVGYTDNIFPVFSLKLYLKPLSFSLFFYVDWYKLPSKPTEANSWICGDTDQGSILNLARNKNCAITYIDVHENVSWLWQIYTGFKDKYIGANHPCVWLNMARPANWQKDCQVFIRRMFYSLLNEFVNCSYAISNFKIYNWFYQVYKCDLVHIKMCTL